MPHGPCFAYMYTGWDIVQYLGLERIWPLSSSRVRCCVTALAMDESVTRCLQSRVKGGCFKCLQDSKYKAARWRANVDAGRDCMEKASEALSAGEYDRAVSIMTDLSRAMSHEAGKRQ